MCAQSPGWPESAYSYTEAGNGELGLYLVSDGSGTPYRVRMRPPCFFTTSGIERMLPGTSWRI